MNRLHIPTGNSRQVENGEIEVSASTGLQPVVGIAEDIEERYQKVLQQMRDLLQEFHAEYRPVPGYSGYMLSGLSCKEGGCQDCPHGIFWRKYTCKRVKQRDQETTLPDESMSKGQMNRSGFHQRIPLNRPESNPEPIEEKKKRTLRRTQFLWNTNSKRLKHLPPRFFQDKKQMKPENLAKFHDFNIRMQQLNKQRALLVQFRKTIRLMGISLRKNKIFADLRK